MDCGAILAPTARPKRIARSTAALFITGSTPGSARSTGLACVFGSAPNLIGEPLKIFDSVVSCTWFSRPMTTSHSILVFSLMYTLMFRAGGALYASWRTLVPVGRQLILVRDVQQLGFAEVVTDDLQSDRALGVLLALAEAARDRHAGQAGQAGRQREDIGQVVGHRVVGLVAEVPRDGRRDRSHDDVADRVRAVQHRLEILRDQAADFLRFQIVGVVVAVAQHIGADHDAALDFRAEAFGAAFLVHIRQVLVLRGAVAVAHAVEAR